MRNLSDAPQPLQARSRDSERRILAAARLLLDTRQYPDISLAEIAQEAQVSHGTLYARFRTKRALLNELHERYCADVRREIADVFDSFEGTEPTVLERVSRGIRRLVHHSMQNRHAVRNFRVAACEDTRFLTRQTELEQEQTAFIVSRALQFLPGADETRVRRTVRTGLSLVRDVLDTGTPLDAGTELDAETLAQSVSEILLVLLGDAIDRRSS